MRMKQSELIEKNIELSTEFSRYVFDHPEIEEMIPVGAEIVFLPEFDQELKEFNLKMGRELEKAGTNVLYIRIGALRPRALSRIEDISLESSAAG